MITQQQVQELKKEFEEQEGRVTIMEDFEYEKLQKIKQTARDYLKEVEKGCGVKIAQDIDGLIICGDENNFTGVVYCESCQKLKSDLMEIINGEKY